LAEQNPQAYLPYVATTLNNMGLLELDKENIQHAQTLLDEALTILRRLWKQHGAAYGNDLAQSFAVAIMLLQRQEDKGTLICDRLHEMATVALQERLKQWAQERMVNKAPCGRTFQPQPRYQGPARWAVTAYVPRLITSPSS